jgi:CHAT domain-containing protein
MNLARALKWMFLLLLMGWGKYALTQSDSQSADDLYGLCKAADGPEAARRDCQAAAAAYQAVGNGKRWSNSYLYLARHLAKAGENWQAASVLDSAWQQAAWVPDSVKASLQLQRGFRLEELGQYAEARKAYEWALAFFQQQGPLSPVNAYYLAKPLANIYTRQGQYTQADLLLQTALGTLRTQGSPHQVAAIYLELATVAQLAGHQAAAEAFYVELFALPALPVLRAVEGRKKRALFWVAAGAYEAASADIAQAETLLKGMKEPAHQVGLLAIRAELFLKQSRAAEAAQVLEQAIQLEESSYGRPYHRELGKLYLLLAEAKALQGAWEPALQHCQAAFHSVLPNYESRQLWQVPPKADWYQENVLLEGLRKQGNILRMRAEATRSLPDLDSALIRYQLALEFEAFLLDGYAYESSQLSLRQYGHELVSEALQACAWAQEISEEPRYQELAFSFLEQGKARLLGKQGEVQTALKAGNDSLRLAESRLQWELSQTDNRLFALRQGGVDETDPHLLSLRERKDLLLRERASLLAKLRQLDPTYRPELVVKLAETQALLAEDQAILAYHLAEQELYVMLVGKQSCHLRKLGVGEGLSEEIAAFRESITGYFLRPQQQASLKATKASYQRLGYELYRHVLEPVAAYLPARLIVLPDGPLGQLPFDALLTAEAKEEAFFAHLPYLIRNHSLSFAPSASWWLQQKQAVSTHQGPLQLLAVAPAYQGLTQLVPQLRGSQDFLFFPLPQAEKEVEDLTELFGGEQLLGKSATKARFLTEMADHQLIHFAGHGMLEAADSRFSFLAFSATGGEKGVSLLYLHELQAHQMNAEMVVLSACETGLGEVWAGEGVNNLARGFFAAGAKSVLTTFWQVSDHQSAPFMRAYYEHLQAGLPKDEALREAKLASIAEDAAPFFWSAYALSGKEDALPLQSQAPWLGAVLSLLLLIGLGFIVLRKRFYAEPTGPRI